MFLGQEELDLLCEMSSLKGTSDKRLWTLGVNQCKLTQNELKQSKKGNYYLEIELTRQPMSIYGYKNKVKFPPITDYIFEQEQAKELCSCFGWYLKEKPSDMNGNAYFSHVYRRVNTFIGKELSVVIWHYRQLRKDKYGDVVLWNKTYDERVEIYDWRQKVFYNIEKYFNWSDISSNFAEK